MKKDIRNLVMVLGFALFASFAVTTWFLYAYGPSGRYLAKNTLVEPSVLPQLNYNDMDPKTNQMDRYQFDKIVYTFWNKQKREQGSIDIIIPQYEQFYNLVLNDDSLLNPPQEVIDAFRKAPPSRLEIKVRTESNIGYQKDSKDLTLVEFAENVDYWRVELNEADAVNQWVYYAHPKITEKVTKLFIP